MEILIDLADFALQGQPEVNLMVDQISGIALSNDPVFSNKNYPLDFAKHERIAMEEVRWGGGGGELNGNLGSDMPNAL